jgi:recombination endonuclease VII
MGQRKGEDREEYLARHREYYYANRDRQLEQGRLRRLDKNKQKLKCRKQTAFEHGLSLEEYDKLRLQATHCPICGVEMNEDRCNKRQKVLDHCHITGQIRGMVCRQCNIVMGQAEDNASILQNAANWITDHGQLGQETNDRVTIYKHGWDEH